MQPDSPYCTKASEITWQQDTPSSVEFDDSYWSQGDPTKEKQWVFPGQHQLPARAQQADLVVLLELGFGFGHNFLTDRRAVGAIKHYRATALHRR